jgi:hypothetical protein
VFADEEERRGAERLTEGWLDLHRKIAGFRLDAVHDLARILRVPGTANGKASPHPSVRLLESQGPVYESLELRERARQGARAPHSSRAQAEQLSLDPESAQLPLAAFDALMELDLEFRRVWRHTRKGEPWTPSSCEQSLANRAVAAGWEDEHVVALIREHRKAHPGSNPDKWRRVDYLAGTIAKARHEQIRRQRGEERDEALDEMERLGTDTSANGSLVQAAHLISLFNTVVASGRDGAPRFKELVQTGADASIARFALVRESGERVELGGTNALVSQHTFKAALLAATGHVFSPVKPGKWDAALQALMSVRTVVDTPEDSPAGQVRGWLAIYLDGTLAEDDDEAHRSGHPFERDGEVYVFASAIAEWAGLRKGSKVTSTFVMHGLRDLGFAQYRQNYARSNGHRTTRPYMHAPWEAFE